MDADFAARLQAGEETVDAADVALLRAVAAHDSLNAAADELDRSYSRAHARIKDLEAALGPLVARERGGVGGGGSKLTENARKLLARFARLEAALDRTAHIEKVVLDGDVVQRDGELAVVETPAGRVQAVQFEPATRVQVTFRADAVTLHDPTAAPTADESSARNRFEGRVTDIDEHEALATVTISVGSDTSITALITRDSLTELDINPGSSVLATVKATATRATS